MFILLLHDVYKLKILYPVKNILNVTLFITVVNYLTACGSKQEADIMFLMDSVNAGKRNTRTALAFLKSIVNELDIDNDNIHIGLM